MRADALDEQIVRLMGKDARQTTENIGAALKVSGATVRRRLKRLFEEDELRIVGVVKPADFGYVLAAVITMDVAQDKIEDVIEALSSRREVRWISPTLGRYDIIMGVRFRSMEALSEFMTQYLAKLDGVKDSETFVCLNDKKAVYLTLG
jgi:Lrp/AsnC family transcriptional regulator for asnA, asnC and gidA